MWLIANWRVVLTMSLILLSALMASLASHYHSKASEALKAVKQQQQTITAMQQQQHDVAAIDAKYTRELNDAKQTITDLQRDVASGAKRLRVNAKCPVPSPATTPGLANDASARPADTVERDYFTLRQRIATAEKQIAGLQEYIRSIQK
ncbi:endopeptidase (lysis protein) [Erwinia phage phiEt88]|uniref:Rz-like spanin n=1 Tax=Erwinia phage phiEt88 TaxID=925984 RepID=UPI0001F1FC51|nr:Rz-like spanin [Erwinia phage phiEt88]CBX44512.1 endopeptidase (lysis protein) [Erwinia phage phiEt88]